MLSARRDASGAMAGSTRIARSSSPAPRTDPRCTAKIDAREVMASFRSTAGLYLHVPFCPFICPFCPYNKVLYRPERASRFFHALDREMDAYLAYAEEPFTSLYIGGGTPTLCLDELTRLLPRIPVERERAIEVLPAHATPETVARLRDIGITHASLGVQSFDERMLRHLGRPGTTEANLRALANMLGAFDCVDVDLIFDVAFRDPSIFLRDVETCLSAGVDQVSTYPLMRFGYTPFGKTGHDPAIEHEILREAAARAERYGYERRSVWTLNRRGGPAYTSITREFYLGLGAGAATYTGPLFLVNHFSVERYVDKLERGRLPVARRITLGPLRSAIYYLFWQAYTGRIDAERTRELFPRPVVLRTLLRVLAWTGHVRLVPSGASLTPRGYDLYHDLERRVTYGLIEPLWAEMMQEHRASWEPPADPPGLQSRIWSMLGRPVEAG